MHSKQSKPTENYLSYTFQSGEAWIVLKLQVPVVLPEVNNSEVSDISVKCRNLAVVAQDSGSILTGKCEPEISGHAGIMVKLQLPVASVVNESNPSELPVANGNSGAVAIHLGGELLPPVKSDPEISRDSEIVVKLQLPAISEVNESLISEVHDINGNSNPAVAAQDCESLASEKCGPELLGESRVTVSVEDCGINNEMLKAQIMSPLKKVTQEFENVKKSSSQSFDGIPVPLKSDHRRPHALSWEVRRMTSSPHREEILSSSLEAFKKIQKERANMLAANNGKNLVLECSNRQHVSDGNVRKSDKVNFVQNGHDHPHNSSSSYGIPRLPLRDTAAASVAGKCKRENTIEKNLKSTDPPWKHIAPSEKDKEKRNSSSWKSMDAWKEKRNWEDILSSPFRVSSLLSHSPEKKKKKTALDLKKEAEEKHARAMRIRSELENERVQKLQRASEKTNRVKEWQAVHTMKLREGIYAHHQRSESRHEAFLAQVVRRAGDERSKVKEVRFITYLNEENKKLMLHQKLHDSELRRAEKLQGIKTKKKDMARKEAVLERRKLIEAEKLQRVAETQREKEEAQVRREEECKSSSAALEARAVEQLRRREERANAQQEEAELLAQKLAERLSEREHRCKFYLEQIWERAYMDFRDQSPPLLCRSMNKEGQGRSTPTNSGEVYQENSVAGAGGSTSTLATGNVTLQHSLK
ncbi:hypothetical protein GH714_021134 [Hevea brasiliensis]|uniref:Uncharacterized protein n=1 Tax=Hevea brasiliensis TaxID=3981 RepID=A0A6A6MBV5_HEVBR|nr:hypothetical protein GH714_021134 [Hevea brasiliensis]